MKRLSLLALSLSAIASAQAQTLERSDTNGSVVIRAVGDDILQLRFTPHGTGDDPTPMMDPHGLRTGRSVGRKNGIALETKSLSATLSGSTLTVNGSEKLVLKLDLDALRQGAVRVQHSADENLYGMRGNILFGDQDPHTSPEVGLLRNQGATVRAGSQGDGGAPIAYTNQWGLVVDSVDGLFTNQSGVLEFSKGSRKEIEAYLVVGDPEHFMGRVGDLTGKPAMPPKWSLGFINSQWGTTENEVTSIVSEYRSRQIPLDGFILDFDFKAWGEDDFGEFRWNSTNNPGNVGGNKFPGGASGEFGKKMLDAGVHVSGIMKPRILTENVQHKPTVAAAEATAHHWWMPGKKPYQDYFSNRLANDLNFADPNLRKWYWKHAKGLFDTGISGWWNDEADDGFDSLGFLQMQQSLFEGQRGVSNWRVWSLNRNFYLGAQRYGFGTWSGDIDSGYESMAAQRLRMLDLINLGQSEWSMDTGGFNGHPSPENYARWMEFASVVPIMRVHNTYGEHRQPWVYGETAEAAAKKAIENRYALFPYLYSAQHDATTSGVGIVRPLNWAFPEDSDCANVVDSWMVGKSLLVSPIVTQGQMQKSLYLPYGRWFDYTNDDEYQGGMKVTLPVDSQTWSDLPMFVRSGSIVATQPVEQYENQTPVKEITLNIWPDASTPARFELYDDDGETMNYERGSFFSQSIEASMVGSGAQVKFALPKGAYRTPISSFRIRIHAPFEEAKWNGKVVPMVHGTRISELVVPAGQMGTLELKS